MMKRAAATVIAAVLSIGGAMWALGDTPKMRLPGPAELSVPGTARTLALACPPGPTATIGETIGLSEEESEITERTRGLVIGGGTVTTPDNLDLTGSPRFFSAYGAHPGPLIAEPGESAAIIAATYQRTQESGELAGLILSPCLPPAATHYFVGGSTATGSSSELVLTNLSATPATVRITVHTSTGTAPRVASSALTVAPGGTEKVLVEALATDDKIALEVSAEGGAVAAHLFTHEMSGASGAGAESIEAGAEPATEVIVPGIDLSGDSGAPSVRIANPGEDSATAQLTVRTDDGSEPVPGAESVRLAPGSVLDIPLDGIGQGWAAIEVSSDVPVLAAGLLAGEDLMQVPSVAPLRHGTATVGTGVGTLVLVAEDATATVRAFARTGEEVDTLTVPVKGIGSVELPAATSYVEVLADRPVSAGLVVTEQLGSRRGGSAVPVIPTPEDAAGLQLKISN
ncbi:MAG: DUF5719 family protein [Flaviflexus sp.]|nr:DUF5719 family protein [Flaviflexus sp.]